MTSFDVSRAANARFDPEIGELFEPYARSIHEQHFPDVQDYRDLAPGEPGGHVGPDTARRSLHLALPRYNVIVQWARELRGRRGLDIGPAFGFLDLVLAEHCGLEIVAAEHPANIPAYSGLLLAHEVPVRPWLLGRDACPFEAESFDLVLFAEVLEHLKLPPRRVLREIIRALRGGGTLILTTPNIVRQTSIDWLQRGENILEPFREDVPPERDVTDFVSHIREYTVGETVDLVEQAGLGIEEVAMCNLAGEPLHQNPLRNHYTCIRAIRR